MQPAPYQRSLAEDTNSALSVPLGWLMRRQKRTEIEKSKGNLDVITYRQKIYSDAVANERKMQVSWNELLRKEFQHGWRRKSFPERKSASRGNHFWHLKGEESK